MAKNILFFILLLCVWGFISFEIVSHANNNVCQGDQCKLDTRAKITDYGNGVYYFEYTKKDFPQSLSDFIAEHPNLELITAAGDGNGIQGRDTGYTVVFRSK